MTILIFQSLSNLARALPRDVVDHESPGGPAVVAAGDGSEPLLARRVPDLQLDLLTRYLDDPTDKIGVLIFLKSTCISNTCMEEHIQKGS